MFRDLYPTDAEEHVSKALQVREMGHRQPAVLDIGSGSGIWYVAGDCTLSCLQTKQVLFFPGRWKWRISFRTPE